MDNKKLILVAIFVTFFLSLFGATLADAAPNEATYQELAEKFSPVLYFHPEEIFRPQPVEVLVNQARLRRNRSNWFDANILNAVSVSDLINLQDADVFLDVWYGSAGESTYKNFSAHRAYYLENLSPDAGGFPASVYARVVQDDINQKIIIQYWLFYYYNDWFNKHEGDWEMVQVILDKEQSPEWVVFSQHHGGTRRAWENIQVEADFHPRVYVALGSHANYFWGDEIYPNGMQIGNSRVEILDRTGSVGDVMPQVIMMPAYLMEEDNPLGGEWLAFAGNWGESAIQSDFGGPIGPAAKGLQWDDPYIWGVMQPLDVEHWYRNRLKLLVEDANEPSIQIMSGGFPSLSDVDRGDWYLIAHTDPEVEEAWVFEIDSDFSPTTKIQFYWPDPIETRVNHYLFSGLPVGEEKSVTLSVDGTTEPEIQLSDDEVLEPVFSEIIKTTWDEPDLVWFAGYLSTNQVIVGVLVSLAAGILPSLLYIYIVYSIDRNEKEPLSLITAAFLWGAIPAVTVAFVVNLFYQIPPDLVGPQAIEAVQVGLFSPLVEELLKGGIVVLIAFRYQKEFNTILDGIIYGAVVGLGFAMTGNIISYLVTFLFRGFDSLRLTILVEGFLFGLNHALYAAIFGAGLGYAFSRKGKKRSIWVPVAAFLLAVAVNGIHGYLTATIVGLTPLTIIMNWLGIGVLVLIMILSIRQEDEIMKVQLREELPEKVYLTMVSKEKRRAFLRAVRKEFGREKYRAVRDQFQLFARLAIIKKQLTNKPSAELAEELVKIKDKMDPAVLPDEFLENE